MSIRNLDKMFRPGSIAVIGASDRPRSVGSALMANLLQAGFSGPILPVNPKASAVHGIMAYKDVASLPVAPDLAVIATPPDTVPSLVAELGSRGTRAAVVLTAGFAEGEVAAGRERTASCSPHRARTFYASPGRIASALRCPVSGSTQRLRRLLCCRVILLS